MKKLGIEKVSYESRRSSQRIKLEKIIDVGFRIAGIDAVFNGTLKDISKGGLAIKSDAFAYYKTAITINTEITVLIKGSMNKIFKAKVKHIRDDICGCEFIKKGG